MFFSCKEKKRDVVFLSKDNKEKEIYGKVRHPIYTSGNSQMTKSTNMDQFWLHADLFRHVAYDQLHNVFVLIFERENHILQYN